MSNIVICQTGLKPAKNAERKHLPDRFPPEQSKSVYCIRTIVDVVLPRRATESARKLIWVEPAIQSKTSTRSAAQ